MAYVDPLDVATPASGTDVSQGDDRIRELKRALVERLQKVFVDLNVDPLTFIAGIIPTSALADLSVTTAKLANMNVTSGKLADSAVETGKILDSAVTFAKLQATLRDKMAQKRSSSVTMSTGYVWAANTSYDYITTLQTTGYDFMVGYSAPATSFPHASVTVHPYKDAAGFVGLRVRNFTGAAVTLSETYQLGVWVIEPLVTA